MLTVDTTRIAAPVDRVFRAAEAVERWPELLPHYRWVRMLERRPDGGVVEMAAWRPFGPVGYPTWWVSEMRVDRSAPAVYYRHVRGITTGMDVVWRLEPEGNGTTVAVHCDDSTCTVKPVADGPKGGHIEGHLTLVASQVAAGSDMPEPAR